MKDHFTKQELEQLSSDPAVRRRLTDFLLTDEAKQPRTSRQTPKRTACQMTNRPSSGSSSK